MSSSFPWKRTKVNRRQVNWGRITATRWLSRVWGSFNSSSSSSFLLHLILLHLLHFFPPFPPSSPLSDDDDDEEELREIPAGLSSRRPTFNSLFETLEANKQAVLDNSSFFFSPDEIEAEERAAAEAAAHEAEEKAAAEAAVHVAGKAVSPLGREIMHTLLDQTLQENNLESCIPVFREAEVDLDAFLILTEKDLQDLGFKKAVIKQLLVVSLALQVAIEDMGGSETQNQLNSLLSNMVRKGKKKAKAKAKEGGKEGADKKKPKKKKEKKPVDPEEQKKKEEALLRSIFAKMDMHPGSDESEGEDSEEEMFPEPGFDPSRRKTLAVATPTPNATPAVPFKIDKVPEVPASSLENPDMKGWLLKQGGSVRNWKKRWFILKDHCLFYYASPKDKKPKGMFALPSYEMQLAQIELKREFAFRAFHAQARTYYFVANNAQDRDKWMEVMQLATVL